MGHTTEILFFSHYFPEVTEQYILYQNVMIVKGCILETLILVLTQHDPFQVAGPYGATGVPLSGLTMFQHQIKAVHESAHMEDSQRQEIGEVERRPRFIAPSPTVLDRDGKRVCVCW